MKYTASLITASRIIGAFVLLLIEPLSTPFFVVYILCCVSDVIDGYIARKTNTASKIGEILDSVADFVLIAVMRFIFYSVACVGKLDAVLDWRNRIDTFCVVDNRLCQIPRFCFFTHI